VALFAGIIFALLIGRTDAKARGKGAEIPAAGFRWWAWGFGIQLSAVIKAGSTGVLITAGSLVATMGMGLLLARWLRVERTTGPADFNRHRHFVAAAQIAAMGPVLGAEAARDVRWRWAAYLC